MALEQPTLETQGMADFPKALTTAFELLRAVSQLFQFQILNNADQTS